MHSLKELQFETFASHRYHALFIMTKERYGICFSVNAKFS